MIRTATSQDMDTLLRLNAVVQSWHAARYPEVFRTDTNSADMRAVFEMLLDQPGCHFLIEDSGAGYLFARVYEGKKTPYGWKTSELHIEHLAVLAERQREGIGSALMAAAEGLARDSGCRQLTLDTWAANTDAHRMFEAVGMTPLRHRYAKRLD